MCGCLCVGVCVRVCVCVCACTCVCEAERKPAQVLTCQPHRCSLPLRKYKSNIAVYRKSCCCESSTYCCCSHRVYSIPVRPRSYRRLRRLQKFDLYCSRCRDQKNCHVNDTGGGSTGALAAAVLGFTPEVKVRFDNTMSCP